VLEQRGARSGITDRRIDDHVLNHGPGTGPVGQIRYHDKLGGAHNLVAAGCDAQMAGSIADDAAQYLPRSLGASRHAGGVTLGELPIQREKRLEIPFLDVADGE